MIAAPQELGSQPEIEFINQLASFPDTELIGKRACGLAVLTMAVNLINVRTGIQESAINTREVLARALELQAVQDVPGLTQWLHVKGEENWLIHGLPIGVNIPADIQAEINANPDKYSIHSRLNASRDYKPIFTLSNGLDHRGSAELMRTYGIKAEQFGDTPENSHKYIADIQEEVREGRIILASVEHEVDSSHIVMLAGIREGVNGSEILEYDPLEKEPKWRNLSDIEEKFRGYGTIIYGKMEDNHDQA